MLRVHVIFLFLFIVLVVCLFQLLLVFHEIKNVMKEASALNEHEMC